MSKSDDRIANIILKLWMDYQGSGTPYGNTFIGFMEWLKDRKAGNV